MQEIWKDIKGYENLYQVSNLGNVKNKNTNKQLYYSGSTKGYLRVGLFKNKKRKMFYIHRLVAQTFIKNKGNKPCVNHKDCNILNNRVENLEWCTYKENNSYKNHHLKRNISSALYYLKKDYPNELDIIKELEKIKEKIKIL
jgi:hypothetical protein